ncbi:hypothetical protein VTN96DRAFT_1591 [Rasamsonia emersonii]
MQPEECGPRISSRSPDVAWAMDMECVVFTATLDKEGLPVENKVMDTSDSRAAPGGLSLDLGEYSPSQVNDQMRGQQAIAREQQRFSHLGQGFISCALKGTILLKDFCTAWPEGLSSSRRRLRVAPQADKGTSLGLLIDGAKPTIRSTADDSSQIHGSADDERPGFPPDPSRPDAVSTLRS